MLYSKKQKSIITKKKIFYKLKNKYIDLFLYYVLKWVAVAKRRVGYPALLSVLGGIIYV